MNADPIGWSDRLYGTKIEKILEVSAPRHKRCIPATLLMEESTSLIMCHTLKKRQTPFPNNPGEPTPRYFVDHKNMLCCLNYIADKPGRADGPKDG